MKQKIIKLIPIVLFLGIIFGMTGASFLKEDVLFSETENRLLKEKPKLTRKSLLNGKFAKKYEAYLSDQFPLRNQWITVKTLGEQLIGHKESNGIYFGKDGYLIEKYQESDFDSTQVKKNLKRLAKFVKKEIKKLGEDQIRVMMVPTKSQVLTQKLPAFADIYDEKQFLDELRGEIPEQVFLDMTDTLKAHQDEEIYFKNDHHWNTLGAYYAYVDWANSLGIQPLEKEDFTIETVTTDFLGTSYSKVPAGQKGDKIDLYIPKEEMTYSVDYNMGEKQTETLYEMDKLEQKDKYEVFLGGNHALLDITTSNKNGKTLLVVKDSFSHCFLPFAVNHFERVLVVDLRHFNMPVTGLQSMYEVTDVLVLYNTVKYMQDVNSSKLQ